MADRRMVYSRNLADAHEKLQYGVFGNLKEK